MQSTLTVCLLLAASVLPGRVESTGNSAALTILYTNDTQGYLQTCGCNRTGLGGLDRRATLIQQARAEGTPLLVLDSGNQADEPDRARVILKAMAAMGYDAIGVGPLDWKWPEAFFEAARTAPVPLVASPPRAAGLPEGVSCRIVKVVGDRQVGVLALGSQETSRIPPAWVGLRPTLEQARRECHLVVVLSQRGLARDTELAQAQADVGLIDLIIGNTEAQTLPEPRVIGRTWLLPTSERGQQVGRVDVTFGPEGPTFVWRLIPLDRRWAAEPTVEGIVGEYYAVQAQRLLDASRVEANSAINEAYVPAPRCGECHPSQYQQWLKQKHAQAVEALAAKQRLVPECLPCHSEQYRRTGQFAPSLGERDGVQCSTCHGEGVVHGLLERKDRIVRNPGKELCVACHNREHDPEFGYEQAWAIIQH